MIQPGTAAPRPPTTLFILLMLLRVAIGWHFSFEALNKLKAPGHWTSAGYLKAARGPAKDAFAWLADEKQQSMLRVVDIINSWGMLVAGLCFMIGLFTRFSGVGLMLMLAMFYFSQPPWSGEKLPMEEGNYLYVNKNLIEFLAISVIVASGVSRAWGIDAILRRRRPQLAKPSTRTLTEALHA